MSLGGEGKSLGNILSLRYSSDTSLFPNLNLFVSSIQRSKGESCCNYTNLLL